jgi:uncharacterized protein (DUF2267 family)
LDVTDFHRHVAARLRAPLDAAGGGELDMATLCHEVLAALADRLTPDEAAELGAELPEELGDVLLAASGDGTLEREEFIEDLAARLDVDDDQAEAAATAVLGAVRECLEPVVEIDQVLEGLPPDLQRMMA